MKDTTNLSIKPITAMPVVRDENGYWTHPEVEAMSDSDFVQEMKVNMLGSCMTFLADEDEEHEVAIRYFEEGDLDAITDWDPQKPCGDGWFIASIHDTEFGPACLWLRQLRSGEGE